MHVEIFDEYNDWMKIIFLARNAGVSLKILIDWSKPYQKKQSKNHKKDYNNVILWTGRNRKRISTIQIRDIYYTIAGDPFLKARNEIWNLDDEKVRSLGIQNIIHQDTLYSLSFWNTSTRTNIYKQSNGREKTYNVYRLMLTIATKPKTRILFLSHFISFADTIFNGINAFCQTLEIVFISRENVDEAVQPILEFCGIHLKLQFIRKVSISAINVFKSVVHYKKNKNNINDAMMVIMYQESFYLIDPVCFDCVFLDEWTSLRRNWSSKTHGKNWERNYNGFGTVLSKALKIIPMDSDLLFSNVDIPRGHSQSFCIVWTDEMHR